MRRHLLRAKRAFTLLEMLLAISISGLLLAAASYLLVSLSTIWTLRTDDAAFDEHADGVAGFLQKAFDESYSHYQPALTASNETSGSDTSDDTSSDETKDTTPSGSTETTSPTGLTTVSHTWENSGVTFAKILANDSIQKPCLHFTFFQFPPALGETNPPTTLGVEAWLLLDDKLGLALVWKDIWSIQETAATDDRDLLRTSPISSFVTRVDYIYWVEDRKQWLEYQEPEEFSGAYTLPQFIRLTFTENDHSVTRLIHIPSGSKTMPLF